ncbi:MAG: GGDEF domain-containing protein [Desulfovibrio sp.]|jgi:diguanylate cyclase (GGDEF)-like protein|nr:GGDEF domain-containing protein [Desulfovibrio sp.]
MRLCRAADECLWSDHGNFCEALENATVPLDGKWPLLVLYLRGIKDLPFLSEVQKTSMQQLLFDVLRGKDFSDSNFRKVQNSFYSVITQPLTSKIEEITRETSGLARDMTELFGRHKAEVAGAAETVDTGMSAGADPVTLLSELRDTLKGVVSKIERDVAYLEGLSQKDSLTGLSNRRMFDDFLNRAVEKWISDKEPVSLIMFDIDHFKKFNDAYGHLVGDEVLRAMSDRIKKIVAPLDDGEGNILPARYGGEEFAVIMRREVAERAVVIAEVIRKTIQRTTVTVRDSSDNIVRSGLRITVSVGVASIWPQWQGLYQSNLIDSADRALYHAKKSGRNRTVRFAPEDSSGYLPVSFE